MPFYTEDEYNEVKTALEEIKDIIDALNQDYIYCSDRDTPYQLRRVLNEKYDANL